MKASRMDRAGASGEFRIFSHALNLDIPRSRAGLEKRVSRRLDVVVDADVVIVLVMRTNADDIARLLDRWIGRDFTDPPLVVAVPIGFHVAIDVNLAARPLGDVNMAGPG